MLGQLAAIGHRRGVARIFGMRFSGFPAWFLWRSAYLIKLPTLTRKVRVMLQWTVDLFFARDTVQLLTAYNVREQRLDELIDSAHDVQSRDTAEAEPHLKVR